MTTVPPCQSISDDFEKISQAYTNFKSKIISRRPGGDDAANAERTLIWDWYHIISRTVAMDTPPPPHRVAMPRFLPRFFMAYISDTMILAPVHPTG